MPKKANTKPKPKKASKSRANNPADGSVVVSRTELLASVSAASSAKETSGTIPITPGSCTWLNTMANSFERYRWESVQIYWRGATGTTFGGLIAFGVDWTGRSKLSGVAIDRKKVTGLTPLCDVPVWTDSTNRPLTLPVSELQTRPWYGLGSQTEIDAGPGNLAYSVYHDTVSGEKFLGEFWIRYRVKLQGTTQAQPLVASLNYQHSVVVSSCIYKYTRTDEPVPFRGSGKFDPVPVGGQVEADWVVTAQGDFLAHKEYFGAVVPAIRGVDQHYEEGDPMTAEDFYWQNDDTNLSFVTTLSFKVPAVLAQNVEFLSNKLITISFVVEANWPTRGGGSFQEVTLELSKTFLSSYVTTSTLGSRGMFQRLTLVGVVSVLKSLADFFTMKIKWKSTEWYEGVDTFGFTVDYHVNVVDTEIKLASPAGLHLTEGPKTDDGGEDPSSLCGSWSVTSDVD